MKTTNNRLNLTFDLRTVSAVLLLIILTMLAIWKPWTTEALDESRVITVTGQSKVMAEPDEFVYYPSYEFKNGDKQVAMDGANQKSAEVITKLKSLGVPDNKLKTTIDSYGSAYKEGTSQITEYTYSLRLTVTLPSRNEAQKIQDYISTTGAVGTVTPQAGFSEAKRKTVESQGRDEATKDARAKAEQSAENLGFKIGKVKAIDDGATGGVVRPLMAADSGAVESRTMGVAGGGVSVQPGENDLTYTVTVTYYIR